MLYEACVILFLSKFARTFLKLHNWRSWFFQDHSLLGILLLLSVGHLLAKIRTEERQWVSQIACLLCWATVNSICSPFLFLSISTSFIYFFSPKLSTLSPSIFYCKMLYLLHALSCQLQMKSRLCLVESLSSFTLHVIKHHLTVCHPAPGLDWLRRDQTLHLCSELLPNTCATRYVWHRATSLGCSPWHYCWMFSWFTAYMTLKCNFGSAGWCS